MFYLYTIYFEDGRIEEIINKKRKVDEIVKKGGVEKITEEVCWIEGGNTYNPQQFLALE